MRMCIYTIGILIYLYIYIRIPITRVGTHPTVQYLIIPPVKSIFIFKDNDRKKVSLRIYK